MECTLSIVLAAGAPELPAGGDLAAALAAARPGDTVRLGPGVHRGTLGRLAGVNVAGAGAGVTTIVAPEGLDGAIVTGEATLSGLSVAAGPERCGLKVLGGSARLDDVAISGGACGAFVEGGALAGRSVDLSGGYGLLASRGGDVRIDLGGARGTEAGVGVLGGTVSLRRFGVTGPAREAGISIAGGSVALEAVVIRSPGPSGITVSAGGRLDAVGLTIAGAMEADGFLGSCVQVIRGTARLHGATLLGCAGAAVEASGGSLSLSGVDAAGGSAGCVVLVNGATADLHGNLCAGRGPGLVAASGSRATAQVNRWWTDPVRVVDCGSGARVETGRGETASAPCAAAR